MDKVRRFNEILKKKEEQQFLMMRVVQIIFFALGGMMMFMPFDVEELYIGIFFPVYLLGMGLVFTLQPYMYIKEGQQLINIYKLLEFMPVSRNDIYKVRKEYLNGICKKILVAYVVCQLITAVLMKEFTIFTILYPAAMTAGLWGLGILYIRSGKDK